jgi:putative membrane protein
MAQHMLLIMVAVPALLLADPFPALVWALPAPARRRLRALLAAGAPLRRGWRALTRMPVAWTLHAVVLWVWHLPPIYDAALAHDALHDLEHVAFAASAVLFWWPVIDPAPRAGRAAPSGRRIVYLVLGAFQSGALGLLLTLSPTALYPAYARAPRVAALDPLEDQAWGGILMWGVGGAIDMLAVLVLLSRFLAEQEAA